MGSTIEFADDENKGSSLENKGSDTVLNCKPVHSKIRIKRLS